jgi:hypothetical protein
MKDINGKTITEKEFMEGIGHSVEIMTIEQDTLNKLRELKFPQYITGEIILNPTLSELIQACGMGFRNLILHTQFSKRLEKPWEAVPNKKLRPTKKSKKGHTPEEAIAKLWIELVNKH